MSILNLRDEDSVPEPDNEVVLPETPPGLDAIRAWIRKPRPWLRGTRLWIDHILSAGPAAWELLKKHGPRAAKWLRRVLRRIAPATRPVAQLGEILRELGEMIRRVADELRDLLGRQTETGAQFREIGRIAERVGGLIVSTTRASGKVLVLLGRLLALLTRLETPPDPAPPPGPPDQPPMPHPLPPGDPKPDEGPAEEQPEPQPRRTPPGSSSDDASTGSATPGPAPRPPPDEAPEPAPPTPPEPAPGPDPNPRPDPTPEPEPDRPPDPTPEPDPDPSPSTPAASPSEPAPTVPSEADLEARLEGLPPVLHPPVLANEGRTPRDILRPLILDICLMRDWSTPKQLARWLDMHRPSLTERHLGPLVRAGLLELQYPDRPSSPRQAYRTCRDRWPPRR